MSFALICIGAIIVLGLLVALTSLGSDDEPIVEAHDCSTCTSKDDGSCKIACLMEEKKRHDAAQTIEEKKRRDAAQTVAEKKTPEGNNQEAACVLNDDDA